MPGTCKRAVTLCIYFVPHTCHMLCPSYPPWFYDQCCWLGEFHVEILTGRVCAFVTKLDDLFWILIFLIKLFKFEKPPPVFLRIERKENPLELGGWLNGERLKADAYLMFVDLCIIVQFIKEKSNKMQKCIKNDGRCVARNTLSFT